MRNPKQQLVRCHFRKCTNLKGATENEKMMLRMMPMMMKDVSMTDVMVKMMPEMLKNINALDIFNPLKNALPNLLKLIKVIKENMPEAMKEKLRT